MVLEDIISTAIKEARPDYELDDVVALAAARIEARFILVDRTLINSKELGAIPYVTQEADRD